MSTDGTRDEFDSLRISGIMNCKQCKQILTSPIITVQDDIGNVCEGCYLEGKREKNWVGTSNPYIEAAFKDVIISCGNKSCLVKLSYKEMEEHRKICIHFPRSCPFFVNENCTWAGVAPEYREHFGKCHINSVVYSKTNNFKVNVPISNASHVKVLATKQQASVLFLFLSTKHKKIEFNLTNTLTSGPKVYCVKIIGSNEKSLNLKCNVSNFSVEKNQAKLESINLEYLKEVISITDSITFIVNLGDQFEKPPCDVENKLSKHLKCGYCKNLFIPPIFQCNTGHDICKFCLPKASVCLFCESNFDDNLRNSKLEDLVNAGSYNCQYRSSGCTRKVPFDTLKYHESICLFRTRRCLFDNCTFYLNHEDLKVHLVRDHFIINNHVYEADCDAYPSETNDYRLAYGHIFIISVGHTSASFYWITQIVSNKKKHQTKFHYTVTVYDQRKPDRNLEIQEVCCFTKIGTNDGIIVPIEKIHSFLFRGKIKFQLKITKTST